MFTWPDIQKSLVPLLFGLPNEENHELPRLIIVGQTATVSTLVTVDGQFKKPLFAGKGGFNLGLPGFPYKLSISPVSYPQIYAPAPTCIYTSKSYPELHEFFPRKPF